MGETRGGGSVVRDPWPVFREEIAVAATGRGEFVGEVPGLVGGTLPPGVFSQECDSEGVARAQSARISF
jgi:hypothetical protein